MGREVRRVPADWEHPRNPDGYYMPLFDETYESVAEEWVKGCVSWNAGDHPDQKKYEETKDYQFYWDWAGTPPDKKYYRPDWPEIDRTHIQMYENTSEGTPISPVMDDPKKLARWLADNEASAFVNTTATYEQWLSMIEARSVVSAVATVSPGGKVHMQSGVAAVSSVNDTHET